MRTSRAISLRCMLSVLLLAVSVSCGDPQATVTETGVDQDPASIRIFWGNGDVSQHIPLTAGETARLEVRLYAANGARIVGFDSHFQISFAFSPPSLAADAAVANAPLFRDVTTGPSAGAHGTVMVTVVHVDMGSTKTFGPFDMLLH
jgi:hypothetical protein